MNSIEKAEVSLCKLVKSHERKIKQIKSRLSSGRYDVNPNKVAKALCSSMHSGLAAIRVAVDDMN